MSQVDFLRKSVMNMIPGHDMQFSRELLMFAAPPPFSPADWILEGITGSAYEFSHRQDPETGNVIFRRRKQPLTDGTRTYISPDRRPET